MDYLETIFSSRKHWGLLTLRLFIGGRLFYGVIDNIISWERMMEFSEFLSANQFPLPIMSAIVSVYLQFLCSIMIILGFQTRLASLVMVLNFTVAIMFVHILGGDSVEGTTPALAMFFGCLTLLFTGAEKLSFDARRKSI